jgi:hypothetical protein
MDLTITKEKVLEAAKTGFYAEEMLKALFPEAFKPVKIEAAISDATTFSSGWVITEKSPSGSPLIWCGKGDIVLNTREFTWKIDDDNLIPIRKYPS